MTLALLQSPTAVEPLNLATNENPLGPSPRVTRALMEAVSQIERYPRQDCIQAEARIARMLGVTPSNVVLGAGASGMLRLLVEAFLPAGTEAVLADNSFPLYRTLIERRGATPVAVPLTVDYRHDLPAMASAIGPNTRLVFICNPNNPTGQPVSRGELAAFMEQVPEHVVVVMDEAYYEYAVGPDMPDGMDWVKAGARMVVVRSFSKAYALAGLRAGYAVAREPLVSELRRLRDPFTVNAMAQVAVCAALDDKAHLAAVRSLNTEVRAEMYAAVEALGLDYIPSATNFVMICCGGDDVWLTEQLRERGIRVSSGSAYRMPGWIRVSTCTLNQLRRFIFELQALLREPM